MLFEAAYSKARWMKSASKLRVQASEELRAEYFGILKTGAFIPIQEGKHCFQIGVLLTGMKCFLCAFSALLCVSAVNDGTCLKPPRRRVTQRRRREKLRTGHPFPRLRMEYNLLSVRINNRSPTRAGVACANSSSGFTCKSLNSSPVETTNV